MTLFTNQIICGECAAVMAEWPADCEDCHHWVHSLKNTEGEFLNE